VSAVPPPTGWFPDPSRGGTLRYWDGAKWLEVPPPPAANLAALPPPAWPPPAPAQEDMRDVIALGYVLAVLVPLVGFILGIVLIAKGRSDHGIGAVVISILAAIVATSLLAA
jgi:hypothetical protein